MPEGQPNRRQTALITGASGGIGFEIARLFAAKGYDLVLVARSPERLAQAAARLRDEHGSDALTIAKDLAAPGAAAEIGSELDARGITVDVLVNNAGFGDWGPFAGSNWETQRQMIQVNVESLVHLTQLMLPGMMGRHRGRILNIGSTGSFVPSPLMAVYCATKAFVLSFSLAISEELSGTGVTMTILCPGNTATGFSSRANTENIKLVKANAMSADAVARIGYRAMMRGRRKIVSGWYNRLMMALARLAPRGLLVRMAKGLMSKAPV
jgi:short-subunit dehydrogenase